MCLGLRLRFLHVCVCMQNLADRHTNYLHTQKTNAQTKKAAKVVHNDIKITRIRECGVRVKDGIRCGFR